MNDAFYEFEWTVAPSYKWQDWLGRDGEPVVVPTEGFLSLESPSAVELAWNRFQDEKKQTGPVLNPLIPPGAEVRRYRPMQREHAALFREFGALDYTNQVSVLEFAAQYGSLGVQTQAQTVRLRRDDGGSRQHFAVGEPFLRWALEICLMREGIRKSGHKRSLETSERLKWLFNRNLQQVQGRLTLDRTGEPRLALEPMTLIAALWLQLALAVTGEKRFVACKFCRRMFEISTDQTGFRSHREFCTDSCKTKDYRKRKRTALSLAASGTRLKEIAETTGTEKATVRAWLAAKKRRVQTENERG